MGGEERIMRTSTRIFTGIAGGLMLVSGWRAGVLPATEMALDALDPAALAAIQSAPTSPGPSNAPSASASPTPSAEASVAPSPAASPVAKERSAPKESAAPAPKKTTAAPKETAAPAPKETAAPAPKPAGASGTFVGPSVNTKYGAMQAQVVVKDGKIVAVQPLVVGKGDSESVSINNRAVPKLQAAVLSAQSAKVSYVSGASYTSQGLLASIAGALSKAGL
jgi:uncharacterized protein with FMN-binding domain